MKMRSVVVTPSPHSCQTSPNSLLLTTVIHPPSLSPPSNVTNHTTTLVHHSATAAHPNWRLLTTETKPQPPHLQTFAHPNLSLPHPTYKPSSTLTCKPTPSRHPPSQTCPFKAKYIHPTTLQFPTITWQPPIYQQPQCPPYTHPQQKHPLTQLPIIPTPQNCHQNAKWHISRTRATLDVRGWTSLGGDQMSNRTLSLFDTLSLFSFLLFLLRSFSLFFLFSISFYLFPFSMPWSINLILSFPFAMLSII